MNFFMIVSLTTLLFHSIGNAFPPDASKFRWQGTEVMGTDASTAEWVRTLIPFKKKTVYSENDLNSKSWCHLVKEKMSSQDVRCSFLFLNGGKFYSMIEVIPENIKFHFREIPKKPKNISIIFPKELEDLFDIYRERMIYLFQSGVYIDESFENGYPDYDNEELHEFSKKIVVLARKHHDTLLNILKYSENASDRAKSALIIPFSHQPDNIDFIINAQLMNDPVTTVRNNVSRYIGTLFSNYNDKKTMKKVIPMFCAQAGLPFMTDQNKALGVLWHVLKAYPDLSTVVDEKCKDTIINIANSSILPNVGGAAKDILSFMKEKSYD